MSAKLKQIEVENKIIAITSYNDDDYICLTDMVRDEDDIAAQRRPVAAVAIYKQCNYNIRSFLNRERYVKFCAWGVFWL